MKRIFLSLIPLLFLLGFGTFQYKIHRQLASDRQLLEQRPQFQEAPAPPFLLAYQENEWAAYLREDLFPADLDTALQANQRALFLDPLASNTWMSIAETTLYQGDLEASRIALKRSDALDPNYPRERLESIQLWKLLGAEDQALQHAARLASLGGNNAVDVARELQKSGFTLNQILQTIQYDQIDSAEIILIADVLSAGGENFPMLWEQMNPDWVSNPRVQSRFVQFSMQSNPEFAVRVWNLRAKSLNVLGNRLVIPNPTLDSSPFDSDFPLGWETPQTSHTQMRYLSEKKSSDCPQVGALEFEFLPKKGRNQKLKLGTFMLLGGEQMNLRIPFAASGFESGTVSMEIARAGKFDLLGTQDLSGSCANLEFTLPASTSDEPVSLSLLVNGEAIDWVNQNLTLSIDGFEVVEP